MMKLYNDEESFIEYDEELMQELLESEIKVLMNIIKLCRSLLHHFPTVG